MYNISGAQFPSSVITAQALEYHAFSDKIVHDMQAKPIINKNYL